MGDWTLVDKWVAGLSDQVVGNETMWIFRFEHHDTGGRVLVTAENEENAWQKLTEGKYEQE